VCACTHDEFVKLMAHAKVMVGNSSAGIREACYFGTPVVDMGSRQRGRSPRGKNVLHAFSRLSLRDHLQYQLHMSKYKPEFLYGDGTAGQQIANILASIELPNLQKMFYKSW